MMCDAPLCDDGRPQNAGSALFALLVVTAEGEVCGCSDRSTDEHNKNGSGHGRQDRRAADDSSNHQAEGEHDQAHEEHSTR